MNAAKPAYLGFGLGLRPDYYEALLEKNSSVDWLEITSENYFIEGGKPLYYLDKIQELYPLVMHGVSLSIGSSDPLDWSYLQQLKTLASRIKPRWISDHFCWTGVQQLNMHDLLPLPYTQEAVDYLVGRIQQVQDFLQQRIALENVSSYLTYTQSEMSEWDFINEVLQRADCYLLLDINNVYVSAINHQFNPLDYVNALPPSRIVQIHLAGHSAFPGYIIDTHDAPIVEPVWALYQHTIERMGPISTLIERDDNMPPFADLIMELQHARHIVHQAQKECIG